MRDDDFVKRGDAIDAIRFEITYAMAMDISTGEQRALFDRENAALETACARVNDIPAADVAPVVRGRWIESYSGWTPTKKCSACGVHFTQFPMKIVVKGEPIKPVLKFCPNCGAKMEVHDG